MISRGILSLLFFCPAFLLSQTEPDHCTTMYVDSLHRAANPSLPHQAVFERWLQQKTRHDQESGQVRDPLITLPVIVHVIHNNEPVGVGHNLSQAQIESQIEVLNEDFRRVFGTPGYNTHPVGADIEVEFCLATKDTAGNALDEPGIHRVNKNDFPNWPAFPMTVNQVENFVHPFTYWDPESYLNIWIVELSGNNLGFAQLPTTDSLPGLSAVGNVFNDGVTINYTNFGRTGNVVAPYNGGRTTTHEVGHFLGLYHIWGDGNCSQDDYCSDTPSADDSHFGCPTGAMSCGSVDMIENYMDYTDDNCMNLFTQCQKLRMRTVLNYSPRRASLANSTACTGSVPPAANFNANFTTACENSYIKFLDNSPNATAWSWSFPGGNPASSTAENPSVKYSSAGTYDVSLIVSNQFGSDQITYTQFITITTAGISPFYEEDFESGLSAWTVGNPDNSITWQVDPVSGSQSGSFAVGINLYGYSSIGARDELISPVFDMTSRSTVSMTFDYAYRPFSSQEKDSLLIFASRDGGLTWPFRLFAGGENGNQSFATNEELVNSFTPSSPQDWCFGGTGFATCKTINLNAYDGEPNFRLKFVSVNDYGNNIWVDNVVLSGGCRPIQSIEPPLLAGEDFRVFPNPNDGLFQIQILGQPGNRVSLGLYSLLGQSVWQSEGVLQQAQEEREIDLRALSPGAYVLRVTRQGKRGFAKIWVE